jgi:hypothetical protein
MYRKDKPAIPDTPPSIQSLTATSALRSTEPNADRQEITLAKVDYLPARLSILDPHGFSRTRPSYGRF